MATANLTAVVTTKGAAKANSELKKLSKTAKVIDINTNKASKSVKSFGKNAATAAAAINGPLGGVASRITAITSLASNGAVVFTALGIAITSVGFAAFKGTKELDKLNVALAKSEALIKATGGAAGFTAIQLQEQAQALALATLASTEGIQKAQGILQTFDKVSSETFTRAIGLAQDLAAVYGGDASTQATLLGKALQDPVKGISALNRVGVTFTDTQKEQIRLFVEGGDTAKAQGVILANLASQVAGAGGAVAKDSLAGAFDTAGQVVSEFTAELSRQSGLYPALIGFMTDFNNVIMNAQQIIDPSSDRNLQALVTQRAEAQEKLAALGDIGSLPVFATIFGDSQADAKILNKEIDDLEVKIRRIQDANVEKAKAEDAARIQGLKRQDEITKRDLAALDKLNAGKALKEKEVQDKRDAVKRERSKLSAQKELETLLALNNTELEAINAKEQQRLDKINSFRAAELIGETEFQAAKTEIERAATDQRTEIERAATEERRAMVMSLAESFSNDLAGGIVDAAVAGDSLGDAVKSSILDISKTILKAGVDQLIQTQVIDRVTATSFLAAKVAETTATTAQAGVNAFAATAAIPIVGPAAAAPAAAAAIAAATALSAPVVAAAAARAQGGQLSAGQSTTFAEKGELEILTPASSSRMRTAQQMRGIMGESQPSNQVSLVVIDQSSGSKEFTQEEQDDGRIVLLIRNTVSHDVANPNSEISKSFSGATTAERRR